jgi:hypothetical protein
MLSALRPQVVIHMYDSNIYNFIFNFVKRCAISTGRQRYFKRNGFTRFRHCHLLRAITTVLEAITVPMFLER